MTNIYFLSKGSHNRPADGRCAMEWVSHVAGEPHTDEPTCVSPLLTAFCMHFNDSLDDWPRQRLRPYLARCIGTAGDGLDVERGWLARDWLVRVCIPAWQDHVGLRASAANLRALPEITDGESMAVARHRIEDARIATRTARESAATFGAFDAMAKDDWQVGFYVAFSVMRAATAPGSCVPADSGLFKVRESAFDLLDRMLPTVSLVVPVRAEEACELVGA